MDGELEIAMIRLKKHFDNLKESNAWFGLAQDEFQENNQLSFKKYLDAKSEVQMQMTIMQRTYCEAENILRRRNPDISPTMRDLLIEIEAYMSARV